MPPMPRWSSRSRFVSIQERQATARRQGSALAQLTELMATCASDVDRMLAAAGPRARTPGRHARRAAGTHRPGPRRPADPPRRLRPHHPRLRGGRRRPARDPGLGPPAALPRPDPEPGRAPAHRRLHRQLRHHHVRQGPHHGEQFQDVFLLDLPVGLPVRGGPGRAQPIPPGPQAALAAGRRELVAGLPNQRAAGRHALPERVAVQGSSTACIGITTHTIDELLAITGPITVPDYGVTIAAGETTLKVLQNTRRPGTRRRTARPSCPRSPASSSTRCSACRPPGGPRWPGGPRPPAGTPPARLVQGACPPGAVAKLGFDGAVRQDPGDYVYPVDSNVPPASKLNAVTDRALDLSVRLDEFGNATNELRVTWNNNIETPSGQALPGAADRWRTCGSWACTSASSSRSGAAWRRWPRAPPGAHSAPPSRTRPAARSSPTTSASRPAPPTCATAGPAPTPADLGEDGVFTYRLTIQKQPGLRPGPLR